MNDPFLHRHLRKTAIEWFLTMQNADAEHEERNRFESWLMSSPAHQAAYEEVCSLWENLDSPDELLHLESAMQQKTFIDKSNRGKKIRTTITRTFSVLLFAVVGVTAYYGYDAWQNEPIMQMVATAEVGQIRSQVLEDGTKLMISGNSNVEITYTRRQRHVILMQGEASFDVAKNPDRPFIVDSGIAKVTVLGTRFAVNKFSSKVRVSVERGTVRVEPSQYSTLDPRSQNRNGENVLTLRGNEVAEITIDGKTKRIQRPAADAFSFETGSIAFDKAGLEEISETLSRYRIAPVQYQLKPNEADVSITAILQSRNVERFIKELPYLAPIKAEQHGSNILLTPTQGQEQSQDHQ